MWIRELLLNNIQSFKDERMTLSNGINLLVGKNNTGKSAVIRALLNFQRGSPSKPEFLLRKLENDGYVLASAESSNFSPTLKAIPEGEMPVIVFEAKQNRFSWATIPPEVLEQKELTHHFQKLRVNGEIHDIPQFSDSEPSNIFLPFLAKRKLQNHQGQFDESAAKKVEHDFRGLATKLLRARSNTLSKEFDDACIDILGFAPSVLPGPTNLNLATIGQYVSTEESITLEQMGDGVAQTIGLLVNIFQASGKIFLIEEVENDLHPEALKKLLQLIVTSSKRNQFIISTHSHIVVGLLGGHQETRIFEITAKLVEDELRKTSIFDSKISAVNNSADERIRILTGLGYELFDFSLWEGYLILEESSAEKLIRDFLIPAFCPKLVNRLGTVAAKGAGNVALRFSNLQILFTFIHTDEVYKNKGWV